MAENAVDIWNMALSHLGHGVEVQDENESSASAAACRTFWDPALEATLRDFPWPDATITADLQLVAEEPTDEWAYSYQYPSDCVRLRRIQSSTRNDTRESRVPYRVVKKPGAAGKLIYTNMEDAVIEYTALVEDVETYPADFTLALSYRLAVYIAPRMTSGDPFKLQRECMALYEWELSRARANALNEEQPEEDPASELEGAREG